MRESSHEGHAHDRMDARNSVMREIQVERTETHDPHQPTRVWLDEDTTPDGVVQSLTIVLNTGSYRWVRAGGYTTSGDATEFVEDDSVGHEALVDQVEEALAHERDNAGNPAELVKIYTSGSFFNEREVSPETRREIAETFADRSRIVVESVPDFVSREKVRDFTGSDLTTDIAVGLETVSNQIRRDCLNKSFGFADFENACAAVTNVAAQTGGNAGVKASLLMKPPFLAEPEAVADMVDSVRRCAAIDGCHTVSVNPCNVHRHTMVDELFNQDGYRPPWLWSVAHVLEETAEVGALVVSGPVGHGSDRGAHNCGDCDSRVQTAIKDFNIRQEPAVFQQVSCECETTWKIVMEEETAYNQPLVS